MSSSPKVILSLTRVLRPAATALLLATGGSLAWGQSNYGYGYPQPSYGARNSPQWTPSPMNRPQTGPGSYMPTPSYGQQVAPAQVFRDPTQTLTYRAVERITPWVGRVRDCAGGSLVGAGASALRGGNPYMGLATGCAGAVYPNFSPVRPFQAY
jgi:hypothetical protein